MNNKTMIKLSKEVKESNKYVRTYSAIQDLHNGFGFDFEKEFIAGVHDGGFTQKSLAKEFNFDYSAYCVVVVMKKYGHFCVVQLTSDNCILPERCLFDSLSAFYTKSDFNECRKYCNEAYVIAQKKEYLQKVVNPYDWRDCKPISINTRYEYYSDAPSYGIIEKGLRKIWRNRASSNTYILDKSGYLVEEKQGKLQHKARLLREEREREAYMAMNNTGDMILRVRSAIDNKKIELSTALTNAKTSEDIKIIIDKLNSWRGLGNCYSDIERIEKKNANKDFSSPESFNEAISRIYTTLSSI